MTRLAKFLAVLSAGATCAELVYVLAEHEGPPQPQRSVWDVMGRAVELPEEAVPEDVGEAARQFLAYAHGRGPAPEWYEEWREQSGAEW